MIRLKIQKHDEECILLTAVKGIEHYGFGTFLSNLKPEEVQCDAFSKQALLDAPEKYGLNGLEIWPDNRIAWGDPSETIIMPINEISKMKGAEKWLQKIGGARDGGDNL